MQAILQKMLKRTAECEVYFFDPRDLDDEVSIMSEVKTHPNSGSFLARFFLCLPLRLTISADSNEHSAAQHKNSQGVVRCYDSLIMLLSIEKC
jgi:hypothetical protein